MHRQREHDTEANGIIIKGHVKGKQKSAQRKEAALHSSSVIRRSRRTMQMGLVFVYTMSSKKNIRIRSALGSCIFPFFCPSLSFFIHHLCISCRVRSISTPPSPPIRQPVLTLPCSQTPICSSPGPSRPLKTSKLFAFGFPVTALKKRRGTTCVVISERIGTNLMRTGIYVSHICTLFSGLPFLWRLSIFTQQS